MSRFKPYPAYKDSGVQWLGKVPEHWKICQMVHLAVMGDDFISGPFGSSLGTANYVDQGIPVIRGLNTTLSASQRFVAEDFVYVDISTYNALSRCNAEPGDIVFTARGTVGKVGIVPKSITQALISPNQLRFRPTNDQVDAVYLFYLFSSINMLASVLLSSDSVAQPNLNLGSLKALKIILPQFIEQTQIVLFLDHETARIDALIAEQQRLIELLKEKRQAVISHAVTKGLDPTVPMKDSGVEWLGEVPAHWSFGRIKNLVHFVIDGPHFSPSYRDHGILFISARNVKVDKWSFSDAKYISEADYKVFCNRVRPMRDDVLLTKGGTTGIARAVDFDEPFQVWVHIAVLRPVKKLALPAYLAYALNSTSCYEQAQLYTRGATNNDLGLTRIVNIRLAWPSISEQSLIVAFLDQQVGKLDAAAREGCSTINLLQERRSALISAAVTGKIDVRDWLPPVSAPQHKAELEPVVG